MALKQARYAGWHNTGQVRFVYLVKEEEIWFSGTDRGTTTINAAEAVIRAICEEEKIRWQDYTFYDIQTSKGYPGHDEPGYYEVNRLVLEQQEEENEAIQVLGWSLVAQSNNYNPTDEAPPGVPSAVYQTFWDLIYL